MITEPKLDIEDIQGHIIPGFGTKFQRFLYLKITDLRAARRPLITIANSYISSVRSAMSQRDRRRDAFRATGTRPEEDPTVLVAMAVSPDGADSFLGLPSSDDLSDEFVQMGMAADAGGLADEHESGEPVGWIVGDQPERMPDIVVILGSEQETRLEAIRGELVGLLGDAATVLHEDRGEMLLLDPADPGAEFEHFGFRDGISQPVPRGTDDLGRPIYRRRLPPEHPLAETHADFGKQLIWPGQFVFGYPKQRGTDPVNPSDVVAEAGPSWMRNGSYLVVRRLRQDVGAFWEDVEAEAARFKAEGTADFTPEALASKLVGRWPNGTPLMRSPNLPSSLDRRALNHFGFRTITPEVKDGEAGAAMEFSAVGADQFGTACPFSAHIRKVNPRDRHESGVAARILLHLFLRRGIAYGPRFEDEPEADRGLIFASYQTSVRNQFRFVQTQWANSTENPGRGQDRIIGQGPLGNPVQSSPIPVSLVQRVQFTANPNWVKMTGGGYFLTPSISGLIAIFAGQVA